MPPRPPLPRLIRPTPLPNIRPRPFPHGTPCQQSSHPIASSFHTTRPLLHNDDTSTTPPNHYATLDVPTSATPAEIKRQFFSLSKQFHPDRNPNSPSASTKFVEISEAYHILSVPEKREKYDRQIGLHRHPTTTVGGGSFSSAGYAGSRAATGLNKKRGTFRGPPPSFYKSGGYGDQGAKRKEYAGHAHSHPHPHSHAHSHSHSHAHANASSSSHTEGGAAAAAGGGEYGSGFGPGQTTQHGSEVPHFDDARHKRTHDSVNEHIYARRRRERAGMVDEDIDRGGTLLNFCLVMGVIGVIGATAKIMGDRRDEREGKRRI